MFLGSSSTVGLLSVPWVPKRARAQRYSHSAGKIKKGGLVEVPMGLTLNDVIFGIGGGIKNDRAVQGCADGRPVRRMYPG